MTVFLYFTKKRYYFRNCESFKTSAKVQTTQTTTIICKLAYMHICHTKEKGYDNSVQF